MRQVAAGVKVFPELQLITLLTTDSVVYPVVVHCTVIVLPV